MSAEYTSNHFVPQWYQRRFLPEDQADRELYLLDLKPEFFRDGRGVRRQRKALRRTGTRRCFAIDDLYTTRVAGVESRELERVFFGEIDRRGKDAVAFFDRFDHDRVSGSALTDLMMYMSTQKLRTPKGLDWLATQVRTSDRKDVLARMPELRSLYGAIWAESVWQIADASASSTKFIISDHPVTVYNQACAPGNPLWSKGPNEPDIRLQGTHTIFPLSSERLLILTNQAWACSPHRSPLATRPNPELFRSTLFNFHDVQTRRDLAEREVLMINWIIKKRAYRHIAAVHEEWLYPERNARMTWRAVGDEHLLMPDPRSLTPGAQFAIAYADGRIEGIDSLGRRPADPRFGHEFRTGDEHLAHRRWCEEFGQLVGAARRGVSWEDKRDR